MNTQDFSTTLLFNNTPEHVYNAIIDIPAWWTKDFSGSARQLHDVFETRFGEVHYSRQQLVEAVPYKKIVWLVTDSRLSFLKDQTEWTGTKICFELSEKDDQTLLRFTHIGLTPDVECYDACSPAWGKYLQYSLLSLITQGKGQPGFPPSGPLQDFTTSITVNRTPEQVFHAIGNVRGWWSEAIEGNAERTGDEFHYHFKDMHRCTIQITEVVPFKKIVWEVKDNYFSFTNDQNEWKDTKIIFELSEQNNHTQLRFTHEGLVPHQECFDVCSEAWTDYIHNSLRELITRGKGHPNPAAQQI